MEVKASFDSTGSDKSDKKQEKASEIWCVPDLGDECVGVEMS